jgi:starch-binding outer membrane protein, SusD/RagB family
MKRNKLFLILGFFVTITGCKKLIEIEETDLLAGSRALTSVTYAEQAVLGAYAAVSTDMNILLNATFADEVAKSEFYNATTTHEWQYGPADVGLRDNFTAIGPNYTIINRANVALEALPKADSTRLGDNTKKARLIAEVRFLRAYAHFELFRYYSGNYDAEGLAMPYMETSTILPSPRIKMGEYFTKINQDLVAAKAGVPNNLSDINRANVATVAGLQARVALYMRDWANAETFASEFIAAVPLATRAQFPGIWTDVNSAELSFRLVRTNTIGSRLGSLFRGTSSVNPTLQIGLVTWKPSEKLWSSYDQANDVRFPSYFKDEPLLTAAGRESRLINKYAGGAYGTPTENVANAKVFRTGEMYLIRAEARAELNRVSGANSAESDINTLRAARINGYTNVVFTSRQQAIDEILLERFKELAYEGHRFFDLKRRSLPVTRLPIDAPSAAGTTLAANDFRFLLPIPLPEVTANPILVQNPGYQ